jgi:hypothetical protein
MGALLIVLCAALGGMAVGNHLAADRTFRERIQATTQGAWLGAALGAAYVVTRRT